MSKLTPITILALALVAGPLLALTPPGPVFGPETYVRTEGPPDTFQEAFPALPGGYWLAVLNGGEQEGDDSHENENRVTSATLTLNGVDVVTPSDLNKNVDLVEKQVLLRDANQLDITIEGDPGSYITVVIAGSRHGCDMTVGRLIMPWARVSGGPGAGPDLTISLKNGCPKEPRHVKIVYLNEDGTIAGISAPLTLAPRASMNLNVEADPAAAAFTQGSIEIFFAGPKAGRVKGYATVLDGTRGIAPLLPSGHRHHRR